MLNKVNILLRFMDCPTHVIKCATNKDFTVHTGNIAAMLHVVCVQEDKPWDWDRLFTEVTSELLTQWEKTEENTDATSTSIAGTNATQVVA